MSVSHKVGCVLWTQIHTCFTAVRGEPVWDGGVVSVQCHDRGPVWFHLRLCRGRNHGPENRKDLAKVTERQSELELRGIVRPTPEAWISLSLAV